MDRRSGSVAIGCLRHDEKLAERAAQRYIAMDPESRLADTLRVAIVAGIHQDDLAFAPAPQLPCVQRQGEMFPTPLQYGVPMRRKRHPRLLHSVQQAEGSPAYVVAIGATKQ